MKSDMVEYHRPGSIMCRNPNRRNLKAWADDLRRDTDDPEWANEALALIERLLKEVDNLKLDKRWVDNLKLDNR